MLLGVFSIITLLAHQLASVGKLPLRQATWYTKTQPTFSDAIAAVREQLWHPMNFFTSRSEKQVMKIPRPLFAGLRQVACYAA